MGRQVIIRTKEQFWKDYVLEGISKKLSKEQIKANLLNAFRGELFGQITMASPEGLINADDQTKRKVSNIIKQSGNKWKSLCMECNKYRETRGMIKPSDVLEIEIGIDGENSVKNTHDNEEP